MRNLKLSAAMLTLALLGGCTVSDARPSGPEAIEAPTITLETGPCFGACPVYSVTVRPDGNGTFVGHRFTAVTGERAFRITPDQYRAFAAHVAPLRPAHGEVRLSGENCRQMATDLPSAEVTWQVPGGERRAYYFYYGCDMERNRSIAQRLSAAPALLPIQSMIGRDR